MRAMLPACLLMLAPDVNASSSFTRASLQQSGLGLILLALSLGGLLFMLGRRFMRRQTDQLQQAVARLQAGQLEHPVPRLPGKQLNALAEQLNQLGKSLHASRTELQQRLEQSLEDSRQLRQNAEVQRIELDMARKEALAASRIRTDFLASMGHEIRTPLNGILGFSQLLHKTPLSAQQLDHLQTIQRSAENLLGRFNQLLDNCDPQTGSPHPENRPFDLRDLLQDCLSVVAPAAHDKQLELVPMVFHDVPRRLLGDALRLQQILINLVSIAIQCTPAGSVVVRVMLEDDSHEFAGLRITIQSAAADPAADTPALQADNSSLAMLRQLVALLGGELGMENNSGADARWWLCISLGKTAERAEADAFALAGQRVAIFEAHPLARHSLQQQLLDCGLEVLCFEHLHDLLQAVATQQHAPQPLQLAVIGSGAAATADAQLGAQLHQLQQLDCQSLLLCPTTELQRLGSFFHDGYCHLQVKPADSRKLTRALAELLDRRKTTRSEPHQPAPLHTQPTAQVLCVDDNPANLLLVKTLLNGLGAKVTAVDSGYAAVQASAAQDFDLILMDIHMPGMDGHQASMAIRQREQRLQLQAIPIIALTAHVPPHRKRSVLQAGMNDLLCKPVSEAQLDELLHRWTGTPRQIVSAQALPPAAQTLAILDHAEGLRLAGGKPELANDLLGMLLGSLEQERQTIRLASASNDRRQLAEHVHHLLGATRYCGVPQLRAACQHCENLLRHGHRQTAPALVELDLAISRLQQQVQVADIEKASG